MCADKTLHVDLLHVVYNFLYLQLKTVSILQYMRFSYTFTNRGTSQSIFSVLITRCSVCGGAILRL